MLRKKVPRQDRRNGNGRNDYDRQHINGPSMNSHNSQKYSEEHRRNGGHAYGFEGRGGRRSPSPLRGQSRPSMIQNTLKSPNRSTLNQNFLHF